MSTDWDTPDTSDTRTGRQDGRVTALTFLAPAAFGLHSLLVPWVAVDDDGADEVYDWWQTPFMSSFEDSSYPLWFWSTALLGIVAVGIALTRASSVDAPGRAGRPPSPGSSRWRCCCCRSSWTRPSRTTTSARCGAARSRRPRPPCGSRARA